MFTEKKKTRKLPKAAPQRRRWAPWAQTSPPHPRPRFRPPGPRPPGPQDRGTSERGRKQMADL